MGLEVTTERMSDEFYKHIIHFHAQGFHPAIHHFTDADKDLPHCHPWGFRSFILKGGYVEKVYFIRKDGSWDYNIFERREGDVIDVEANHIHQILDLPTGECFTLVIAGKEERKYGHYHFNDETKEIFFRKHGEDEFKPFRIEN